MSAESDWVSALATAGATVVSIVAAFIAAKSASASQLSAKIAAKVLQRSAMRELVAECHELIAEELRIQSLVIELKSEYSSNFIANGSFGSSRQKVLEDSLEKDLAAAIEQTKEAKSLLKDQASLIAAAGDDLDLMQGRIEAARANLQTIREAMTRQLESLRSQKW
jgi:hypothetical protein